MLKENKDLDHCLTSPVEDFFSELKTNKEGLSDLESGIRLKKDGYNVISEKNEVSVFLEFLSHFKSPLIIVLMVATAISAYFGEVLNSIIIGIMILASVILDFFEEHSANQAAKKLKEKVSITSTVIRARVKKEIKSSNICVGDVVFLSSGDLVPADARIIEASDFFVNQSSLTGESFPKEKTNEINDKEKGSINDYDNVVFLGSSVVSGTATVVVFAIGKDTLFGKIAKSITGKEKKSDFEIGVIRFGYLITKIIIFLVLAIFLFNSLVNKEILNSFMFAIAIAVGVTPELLPVIMSVTMSRGALRMSRSGVIVKKLASIPEFGSMDILCTDKTGTLTLDEIKLVTYTDIFGKDNERVLLYSYLNSFYQTGIKNPLDKAVLEFRKSAIDGYQKVKEIPFDFVRKMMSIVVANKDERVLITKGAPEEVLKKCVLYLKDHNFEKLDKNIENQAVAYYEKLSAEGYRVLAVAYKPDLPLKDKYTHLNEEELVLLGFISFLDPAKDDVKEVLQNLEKQGIEIKVITGDNELVTKRICEDVGLNVKGVLLGKNIEEMTDDALRIRVENTTIFARFSPDQKNRIINALRASGHVVGYLGDGINDAPSLMVADVGISVENAVDVARESANIILTQKSLQSISMGVLEGRKSFGNTMKYIMMGLSSNFGNMFSVIGAIFFVPFLPMIPIQILLNNFIYDFSQITIPSDKVDSDWIDKPRKWDLRFIKKFMYVFGPISSVFDILTFVILLYFFKTGESGFQTGWFIESLATQTLVIHIIRTRQIPFIQSRASKLLLFSTLAAVAVGWIIPYTALGKFFHFSPLPAKILIAIGILVLVYLCVVEIVKRIFYKKYGFMDSNIENSKMVSKA